MLIPFHPAVVVHCVLAPDAESWLKPYANAHQYWKNSCMPRFHKVPAHCTENVDGQIELSTPSREVNQLGVAQRSTRQFKGKAGTA